MHIRPESADDIDLIQQVTMAAFLDVAHSDHTEQRIVQLLRDSGALTISLVAEKVGRVIGHVAVSPVSVSDGAQDWFGLGPISVLPLEQGQGIGSALMYAALAEMKKIKAQGCVLLGEPDYYQRFGFRVIEGLILPGVPPEYFQAISFVGGYPQGTVSYHQAFFEQK